MKASLRGAFMSLESIQLLLELLIGFAVAGMLSCGYQLVAERPLSFRLLGEGEQLARFLAVPVLTLAAPFVIMRNAVRGRRIEGRRFELVMLATLIAGFWSLMSGTFIVMTLQAVGVLA